MPFIKTRYGSVEVGLDDEVHLVVPARFATPTIHKRSRSTLSFSVRFWDVERRTTKYVELKTLSAAEEYVETVRLSPESCLRTVLVSEILANPKYFQEFYRLAPQAIDYEHRDVPLDPFYVGMHLGDGHTDTCNFTTADKEMLDYVTSVAASYDLEVVRFPSSKYSYRISRKNNDGRFTGSRLPKREVITAALADWADGMSMRQVGFKYKTTPNTLKKYKAISDAGELDQYYSKHSGNPIYMKLKELGVIGNKHIPELYLQNSRDVRLKVLAGLIDTDGHLECGGYKMCFANERLISDVVVLARSLGFICPDVKECKMTCTNAAGGPKVCKAYITRICGGNELRDIPLLMPHKRITEDKKQRYDQLRFEIMAA
jgi:hypothetical protein